ncbi:MAG: CDP-glucose 4,6-dehydratase [Candidatus Dadabacteria bacterium]|nr:MAG: CDP-glucose 4,6-dehydratase [Candidatus Dadabacteria bacterium]
MENLVDLLESYRGRRVLVTGHTGFKGSWLCTTLEEAGAIVAGLALNPDSQPNHYELLHLNLAEDVRADIARDAEDCARLVASFKPDDVFHLAAQSLVRRAYRHPVETFATNVTGTATVLDAIRQNNLACTVVVATSDKCYENREWVWPYRENDRLGGRDPYSASKAAQEMVARAFRDSYFTESSDITLATTRAGNIIGGGDWAEDRIIPDIVRAVEAKRPVRLRNPEAVRPWQHVLEPVFGYLLLAARMRTERKFADAWNFGPPENAVRTVRDLTERFIATLGRGAYETDDSDTFHEAKLLRIDASRARYQLGWDPRLDFESTVSWTAEWYRRVSDSEDPDAVTREQIRRYSKGMGTS